MNDKTELQSEATATGGLSSPQGELQRLVMLAVNTKTGEVDYDYIQYDLRNIEEAQQEHHALIDGWVFKPFKVIPAT